MADLQDDTKPTARSNRVDNPILVRFEWVDAHNNQGAWLDEESLREFAKDEAYQVTQVGYLVYEDELCYVIASRLSKPSKEYGQSFGMIERIPKRLITSYEYLKKGDWYGNTN